MSDDTKKDPKALIQDVLGLGQPVSPQTLAAAQVSADPPLVDPSLPPDEQAKELVDLYFSTEEPIERDVVFDKLAALQSPVVDDFFTAMMDHDEDEFLRVAAAGELAKRGHAEALARLQQEVAQPSELTLFAQALQTLAELQGAAFYPVAAGVWRDAAREGAERREAMQVMEWLDTAAAMGDFLAWLDGITDVHHLQDDLVEVAMAAFVRQDHTAAVPVLQALQQRILAATWDDAEERDEAAAFVREGIELLTAS